MKSCSGKVTTVEVVVRDGRAALFAKGSMVVQTRQIAELREIVAAIHVSTHHIDRLREVVAQIEGGAL
jgi:hypothetical protein